MIIFRGASFVLMGIAVVVFYVLSNYKKKKQKEYGNDERWKSIVSAAAMVVYRYNIVMAAIVVLGINVYRRYGGDIYFRLDDVLGFLLLMLLGGSIAEFIAFNIYDRKM
ncbi:MAG: hypothetical protein FWC77_01780 [Defluviitaleaceae bacterium]|nr:hypothetical protein [Defluviitaleaceae bacterium]